METPKDTTLPFFSYGIFKPGQLCFARIKEFVDTERTTKGTVKGLLKERDGIPLLDLDGGYKRRIRGYTLFFRPREEEEGYRRIASIDAGKVCKWGQVEILGHEGSLAANVLLGRRPNKGTGEPLQDDVWDGRKDPLFNEALEEIEMILKDNRECTRDYKALFRLQMAYGLLWSAIERYAGLRFHLGEKVVEKIMHIAEEDSYVRALKRHVGGKRREVYRSSDLDKYVLNVDEPKQALKYYYQVRSNAVHRGKGVYRDFETVRESLIELLCIFKDILKVALGNKS